MFTLAMEAKARGRGVVGSTSDILGFIAKHVTSALQQPFIEPLQVCPLKLSCMLLILSKYFKPPCTDVDLCCA